MKNLTASVTMIVSVLVLCLAGYVPATADMDVVNLKVVVVDPSTGQEAASVTAANGTQLVVRLYGQCPTSGLWAVGGDIVASGAPGALDSSGQFFSWTISRSDEPLWQWTGSEWLQVSTYPTYSDRGGNFAGSPPPVTLTTETYDDIEHVTGYSHDFAVTGTCAAQPSPADETNWFKGGIPGSNGGMTCLGSGQGITVTPDTGLGRSQYALLGSYTVTVLDDTQPVTLAWQELPWDLWTICMYYNGWYTSGTESFYAQIGTITPVQINPMTVTPGSVPSFVYEGWTVDLTATSSSSDPSLVYSWTQTGGASVTDLTVDPATGNASFSVPRVELTTDTPLTFTVTATDSYNNTASASVTVNAYIMGDVTHNNQVNNSDQQAVLAHWNSGPGYSGPEDLDGDGYVNLSDLKLVGANSGRTLGPVAITVSGNPSYVYEGRPVNLTCSVRSIHGDPVTYTWTQTGGAAVIDPSGAYTASYSFTVPTLTYIDDTPLTFRLSVNAGQDGIATKTVTVNAYMLGDISHNNVVDNSGIGNDYSRMQAAMNSHPGDTNWNAAADFNGDETVDANDAALVSSWNRTLTPPIALSVGSVPEFVYETWPVTLTCSATSARNDALTYSWTQIWGPTVTLSGAHTKGASFTVPTLQILDDEWLGFTVTVTDAHGAHLTSDDIWVDTWMMGDVTHDYYVDSNDTAAVTAAWGTHPGETNWNAWADLNNDGVVDSNDMSLVTSNLGRYLDYGM